MTVNRRTVIKGALAAGVATQVLQGACRAGASGSHPCRIPDREDRAARFGRPADGTGPHGVLQGTQQHARGPAGGAAHRRHRRQSRPGPHQDAGTGGASERRGPDRAARRLRSPGDRRLRALIAHADPLGGRRGGHDPAQAQSMVRPRELHVGPAEPSARRIRRQGPRLQARRGDRRRLRVRPRERGRVPARVRGQRRQGGAEAVYAAQRAGLRQLHLAAQAQSRRRLYRTCRLERLQVHPPAPGIRQQGANPRRLHAGRRIAACSRWATMRSGP